MSWNLGCSANGEEEKKMLVASFIWILYFMNLPDLNDSNVTRYRRSSSASRVCHTGCATCSSLNGCLSCKPRLFFHLDLHGMRQTGVCLSSCPHGHYGVRSPHINTCIRCKDDCASCFSESFCTRCHLGRFLFRGTCVNSCPKGFVANAALRECTACPVGCELCVTTATCLTCGAHLYSLHGICHLTCPTGFEPDTQLLQCIPQVHCEVGEWTEWSPCVRKRVTRAFRRGEETRTRQVLRTQSFDGDRCPHASEWRRCVFKMKRSQRRPE